MTGLPLAWGPPPARGRIRAVPEDFRVDELLGFAPDGTGTHVLLYVEKRGANSGWVAAALACAGGVAIRDVGMSGQKDRDAVTRQYYSVPATGPVPTGGWVGFEGEGFRVLEATPHGRKLRIGTHRANRFRIVIREVAGNIDSIGERLRAIDRGGVPNYFGPQRFGRGGHNLRAARSWAAGARPPRERTARSFALSAARSSLFNAVLGTRVREGTWNRLQPGDAAILDGRRSFFVVAAVDQTLDARCAELDLHPSGPLYGRGDPPVSGATAEIERQCAEQAPELIRLLDSQGLEHERRSLRLAVRSLRWQIVPGTIELDFVLPRGAFATAVIHELLEDAWDADERGED